MTHAYVTSYCLIRLVTSAMSDADIARLPMEGQVCQVLCPRSVMNSHDASHGFMFLQKLSDATFADSWGQAALVSGGEADRASPGANKACDPAGGGR